MKEIEQYIETYFGIGDKDLVKISHFFEEKKLEKGAYFLKKGKFQSNLSFIKSGYLRIFNTDPNSGKEITQWISTPGHFIADLSNLAFGLPNKFDIQALSDCELFTISNENYKSIGSHIPNWERLEKLFIAKCFSTLEDRMYSHLAMSSEERYKFFFAYNPELFNQVPLQYIASMLGMTPETFSRIRKKVSS